MYRKLFLLLLLCTGSYASQAQYCTVIAGTGTAGYSGDGGPATAAKMGSIYGMCIDRHRNIYVTDVNTMFPHIRRISLSTGIITTIGGGGGPTATADGIPAIGAYLNFAYGLCMDTAGNLLIADKGRVRKITLATGIITTVAGNDTTGYTGDGGPATAAELSGAIYIAVDTANNIYISDNGNNVVRKVNATTGIITTFAGGGKGSTTYSGDGGPATAASLWAPTGLYVDDTGNVLISDELNGRLRRVSAATGIITTIAGGTFGGLGDGGPATAAELDAPWGITMDKSHNIYFSDINTSRIRRIDPAGIITTYAGDGGGDDGAKNDGRPATSAHIYPDPLCIDTCGNFYTRAQNVILAIASIYPAKMCGPSALAVSPAAQQAAGLQVYPNPAHSAFSVNVATQQTADVRVVITNAIGQKIKELAMPANQPRQLQLQLPGVYFISANAGGNVYFERVVVE